MSGTSGMNAMAHAIEALYAREANPIVSALAFEAIGALARALPVIATRPAIAMRGRMRSMARLAVRHLSRSVGMALAPQALPHAGRQFRFSHAETHTIVLPHALAYNAPAIPGVMARLRPCSGASLRRAVRSCPRHRRPDCTFSLGMPRTASAVPPRLPCNPTGNPRRWKKEAITALIGRAYSGARPVIA